MTVVYLTGMALSSLFGLVILGIIVFILADWARRAYRSKHPARADRERQPAPGQGPVPGKVPPRPTAQHHPALRAPAPGLPGGHADLRLLGRVVATANFYDSGATVTYDHLTQRRYIDLPEPGDDTIEDFFREAAP